LTAEQFPHGTMRGYRLGCHGDDCRAANTARTQAIRARLRTLPAEAVPHGPGGYDNYACRCLTCGRGSRRRRLRYEVYRAISEVFGAAGGR
jgi:hypothetical protein